MQRLKVAAGLGLVLVLTACGESEAPRGEPYRAPSVSEQEAALFGEVDVGALPAPQRAALVTAHVEAALALYRAGETEAALEQLSVPDPALRPELMVGLDTLGYDQEAVNVLADWMTSGGDAVQAEPAMLAAVEMLAKLRSGARGDIGETTEFLMKQLAREFEKGADAGTITDPVAYQTAYGLAVAARDLTSGEDPDVYGDLRRELDFLVLMWPRGGPVSTAVAPPELQMAEQLSRVKLALAAVP
ncbi:MAG TPA: hypothetical protein PKV67_15545 [Hyphomonas sp.]|nr:hypothetical protein [Hyphomonas sp.]HRJ02161.1 hypothetical protein [Hyphomonas sp.]